MRFPYWICTNCGRGLAEVQLPLSPRTQVPICSECKTWVHVDVALGDENTEIDTDTVIWRDE